MQDFRVHFIDTCIAWFIYQCYECCILHAGYPILSNADIAKVSPAI